MVLEIWIGFRVVDWTESARDGNPLDYGVWTHFLRLHAVLIALRFAYERKAATKKCASRRMQSSEHHFMFMSNSSWAASKAILVGVSVYSKPSWMWNAVAETRNSIANQTINQSVGQNSMHLWLLQQLLYHQLISFCFAGRAIEIDFSVRMLNALHNQANTIYVNIQVFKVFFFSKLNRENVWHSDESNMCKHMLVLCGIKCSGAVCRWLGKCPPHMKQFIDMRVSSLLFP